MKKYVATTNLLSNVQRMHTLYVDGNLECHVCKYNKYLNKDGHIAYICSFLSVFGRKYEITLNVMEHCDSRPDDCPFELVDENENLE
jgi:hypothetical protein